MEDMTRPGMRLLFPIKTLEHGEKVQDILFANKDKKFDLIAFLHVIENDMLADPPYTSVEAISRVRSRDSKLLEARSFLQELAGRTRQFMNVKEIVIDSKVADDTASCIIEKATSLKCNQLILLADSDSLNSGWFSPSVLKPVMKKAPQELRVHVIRAVEVTSDSTSLLSVADW